MKSLSITSFKPQKPTNAERKINKVHQFYFQNLSDYVKIV